MSLLHFSFLVGLSNFWTFGCCLVASYRQKLNCYYSFSWIELAWDRSGVCRCMFLKICCLNAEFCYLAAFLWQLMRFNILQLLKNLRSHSQGKEMTDTDILNWANKKVKSTGRTSHMESFKVYRRNFYNIILWKMLYRCHFLICDLSSG